MSSNQITGWHILSPASKALKLKKLVKLTTKVHEIVDEIKASEEEEQALATKKTSQPKDDWTWPEAPATSAKDSWDTPSKPQAPVQSKNPWDVEMPVWDETPAPKVSWGAPSKNQSKGTGSEHDDSGDDDNWADLWPNTINAQDDWANLVHYKEWGSATW